LLRCPAPAQKLRSHSGRARVRNGPYVRANTSGPGTTPPGTGTTGGGPGPGGDFSQTTGSLASPASLRWNPRPSPLRIRRRPGSLRAPVPGRVRRLSARQPARTFTGAARCRRRTPASFCRGFPVSGPVEDPAGADLPSALTELSRCDDRPGLRPSWARVGREFSIFRSIRQSILLHSFLQTVLPDLPPLQPLAAPRLCAGLASGVDRAGRDFGSNPATRPSLAIAKSLRVRGRGKRDAARRGLPRARGSRRQEPTRSSSPHCAPPVSRLLCVVGRAALRTVKTGAAVGSGCSSERLHDHLIPYASVGRGFSLIFFLVSPGLCVCASVAREWAGARFRPGFTPNDFLLSAGSVDTADDANARADRATCRGLRTPRARMLRVRRAQNRRGREVCPGGTRSAAAWLSSSLRSGPESAGDEGRRFSLVGGRVEFGGARTDVPRTQGGRLRWTSKTRGEKGE